jgi:hypothetical protein
MRFTVLCLAFLLGTSVTVDAQEFLNGDALSRVMKILVGPAVATAFLLEVDKRQYLITAKHVVATIGGDRGEVELFQGGGRRKKITVKVLRCNDPTDIAVLVPPAQLIGTNQRKS